MSKQQSTKGIDACFSKAIATSGAPAGAADDMHACQAVETAHNKPVEAQKTCMHSGVLTESQPADAACDFEHLLKEPQIAGSLAVLHALDHAEEDLKEDNGGGVIEE